ncbi:MAG: acetylornithine deacetylase [Pseudomonadota bacterium]
MTASLDSILNHLRPLIAADTQNPPRGIDPSHPLLSAIRASLPDFQIDVRDLGEGRLIIDARRGETPILFNVHMDTVPIAKGWSHDPHDLTLADDRAYGLGTCDTKGAAGVLFALAEACDHPFRILLTTDEEAGKSDCIRTFLQDPVAADVAVVAEPTDALARLQHRGLASAQALFKGESAHASEAARPSAVHRAAQFISEALASPFARDNRLNFGRIEGGVKANMVAAETELLFGFRARPGTDHTIYFEQLRNIAEGGAIQERFIGPALPSDEGGVSADAQARALAWCRAHDLPMGEPVDFWTEASLFSAAGIPSLVLGAGSITQAHNADEFVTYDQLTTLYDLYERIVAA